MVKIYPGLLRPEKVHRMIQIFKMKTRNEDSPVAYLYCHERDIARKMIYSRGEIL